MLLEGDTRVLTLGLRYVSIGPSVRVLGDYRVPVSDTTG